MATPTNESKTTTKSKARLTVLEGHVPNELCKENRETIRMMPFYIDPSEPFEDLDAVRSVYLKYAGWRYRNEASNIREALEQGQSVVVCGYSYGCIAAGLSSGLGWRWLEGVECEMPVPDRVILCLDSSRTDDWSRRLELFASTNTLVPAPKQKPVIIRYDGGGDPEAVKRVIKETLKL